jgi:hypothetical protein
MHPGILLFFSLRVSQVLFEIAISGVNQAKIRMRLVSFFWLSLSDTREFCCSIMMRLVSFDYETKSFIT